MAHQTEENHWCTLDGIVFYFFQSKNQAIGGRMTDKAT